MKNHTTVPNKSVQATAGSGFRELLSIFMSSVLRAAPDLFRSPMRNRAKRLSALAAITFVVLRVAAAERSYYDLFTEALTNEPPGMIGNTNLVNTNNPGPIIPSNMPFLSFRQGELAGIKLGMTMSEVVTAWGKPRQLTPRCVFGPRLWYGRGRWFGEVSLSFKGDRLVLIGLDGDTAKHLTFDNGLAGNAGRAEFEKVLGEPSVRDPKDPSLYNGDIAYRTHPFRMDFRFDSDVVSPPKEHLLSASVRIEAEAQRDRPGEQATSPNGRPPTPPATSDVSEGRHR